MSSINVLLVAALHDECKDQISEVNPRIVLLDAAGAWKPPDKVTPDRLQHLSSEKLDIFLPQAEVIYGYVPPGNMISRAPQLKWFQTMLAGVDHFLDEELIRSKVIITNMTGAAATPVAEYALTLMAMLAKQAPFCFNNKQDKKWERFIPRILRSATVGIVGLGRIGREVARLSKAYGMRVMATRRSAKPGGRARYVDELLPGSSLGVLLAQSDFVVLTLPRIRETEKIIGMRELRAMKKTAYLVNVGRGETVDEEALVKALEENTIAGAGLDAFSPEPLPRNSRLWDLPNVIISPHASGRIENYDIAVNPIFCRNLERYVNGRRLFNIVDKKKGY
jgi:phosphoglycerate dehydrogenase-like enzyme